MATRDVGSLVVIEDGHMSGIITERDVSLAVAHDADPDVAAVGDWMSDYPCLARVDWDIEQAMDVMVEHGFRHLPVLDAMEPVGVVSIKDLLWAIRSLEQIRPAGGLADGSGARRALQDGDEKDLF
jgi:CBS domain-containing protein